MRRRPASSSAAALPARASAERDSGGEGEDGERRELLGERRSGQPQQQLQRRGRQLARLEAGEEPLGGGGVLCEREPVPVVVVAHVRHGEGDAARERDVHAELLGRRPDLGQPHPTHLGSLWRAREPHRLDVHGQPPATAPGARRANGGLWRLRPDDRRRGRWRGWRRRERRGSLGELPLGAGRRGRRPGRGERINLLANFAVVVGLVLVGRHRAALSRPCCLSDRCARREGRERQRVLPLALQRN
mmetsp:Transcript_20357/g.61012  ORF Transcript_20357/g.61012 Transcript_20357/m.61012 type:complete len:246 (+) Transcript_20357:881-1618(+)